MLRVLLPVLMAIPLAFPAAADPVVKVINFTADWCPNCKVLNPRLNEALSDFEAREVELVKVDMTDLRGNGQDRKWQLVEELKTLTLDHEVRYLWDWYGGYTGIAILVAADTGEPISCIARIMSVKDIHSRIEESIAAVRKNQPGGRAPEGPQCPAPMRPQN